MIEENNEPNPANRGKSLADRIVDHPIYLVLIVVGLIFLLIMLFFPNIFPPWVGIKEVRTATGEVARNAKTLWDWVELLIIPAFLVGGAAWVVRSQRKRAAVDREFKREIAEKARDANLEIAERARQADRDIAKDKQEQVTMENYFDLMFELLLNHDLRSKSDATDEERRIARARTLTVLRSLNRNRRGEVICFLHESNLINTPNPTIDLSSANISFANLGEADLSEAVLAEADLSKAELSTADLHGSDLRGVNLGEANLWGANLSEANLSEANLSKAILDGANLSSANLRKANLSSANLWGANLRGANLWGANMLGDNLSEATLDGAALLEADLSKANLSGAKLRDCKYNDQTIWPNGFDPISAGAVRVDDYGLPIADPNGSG